MEREVIYVRGAKMTRQPDSVSYELGHWESMTINRALNDLVTRLKQEYKDADDFMTEEKLLEEYQSVKEIERIFATGTHTIIHKEVGQ